MTFEILNYYKRVKQITDGCHRWHLVQLSEIIKPTQFSGFQNFLHQMLLASYLPVSLFFYFSTE